MKKLFFFAMLAVGMTAACQKPTVEVMDSDEPVAIQFGMNAPTVSVTKTKAPVDTWATSNTIHVVAYNYHTDGLLWVESGTPAAVGESATIVFDNALYYDVNYAYDFRAYYLGDSVEAGMTNDALTWEVPFTIDGTQDIMTGLTNRDDDIDDVTGGDTVGDYQMYSAYAARRGVHPSLTFHHMLTRLNVTVEYPIDDVDENLKVTLENLTVDTKTTGTLLLEGTPSVTFDGPVSAQNISLDDNTGTIMIEPNLSEITFKYDLIANAEEQTDQSTTIKASSITGGNNTTAFLAGNQYNVTIKVYNLQEIVVSATLTEWGNGGNVQYDPDSDGWTPDGYTGN